MFSLVSRTLNPMFQIYRISPVFITGVRTLSNFIDPREDIGFKRLFQNPIAVKSFLNSLMEDQKIIEVTLDPNEQTSQYILPRTFIDIYCKTDKGETFIVEMQRFSSRYLDNQNFIPRIQLYGSKAILAQHELKKFSSDVSDKKIGFQYKDLSKVYVVAILAPSKSGERYTEDYFFKGQDPIKHFKFCNTKLLEKNVDIDSIVEKTMPNSLLHFTFVELKKIHNVNIANPVLKEWLELLSNAYKMDRMPESVSQEVKLGYELLDLNSMPMWIRQQLEAEIDSIEAAKRALEAETTEMIEKSEAKGRAEGEVKGRVESTAKIIKQLIDLGVEETKIAKAAGISLEQLQKIQENGDFSLEYLSEFMLDHENTGMPDQPNFLGNHHDTTDI